MEERRIETGVCGYRACEIGAGYAQFTLFSRFVFFNARRMVG